MLQSIDVARILFLDVECVSGEASWSDLDPTMQDLWSGKARSILRNADPDPDEETIAALYEEKAGIFAEFGKAICISVGVMTRDSSGKLQLRLKSFAGDSEAEVLTEFNKLIDQYYPDPAKYYFCGHNIKEFDVPYLCRRMVVHQIPHPRPFQLYGKKPWETKHLLDTMELWKFGDRKNYTALKLLAGVLGFPSPKDDIDGSEVGRVYWQEKDLARISHYCEKDVLATVQLFLRFKYMPLLEEDQV
ncbi:MAG: 3'-5' exonuclease, partial [Bacteroidetes bacterium]|nr:3'-5' exonuclease [Bacteroidota bacterium]